MKYFLLLLVLPLFSFAQSDVQMLPGVWVKVKAQMKDGSRIVDHYDCGMDFIKYDFTADGFVNRSTDVLFDGYKMRYKLNGDSLYVGNNVFNVISLKDDTMKLSYFVLGAEDNQLPVYYFVKTSAYRGITNATFNTSLKDSVYQANGQFFPQCKTNFNSFLFGIRRQFDNGTLKFSFIVTKKGRAKGFTVLSADSISKGFASAVDAALGGVDWIPAEKNGLFVNSVVQVTLITRFEKVSNGLRDMNSVRIEYPFLPKSPYGPIDNDDHETEQQYFKNAINQYNNHNYDKAIEFLNKCIGIDKIDLNAYALRAMVNSSLRKSKEACSDWTILAGYGQVTAIKNLAKFCK